MTPSTAATGATTIERVGVRVKRGEAQKHLGMEVWHAIKNPFSLYQKLSERCFEIELKIKLAPF